MSTSNWLNELDNGVLPELSLPIGLATCLFNPKWGFGIAGIGFAVDFLADQKWDMFAPFQQLLLGSGERPRTASVLRHDAPDIFFMDENGNKISTDFEGIDLDGDLYISTESEYGTEIKDLSQFTAESAEMDGIMLTGSGQELSTIISNRKDGSQAINFEEFTTSLTYEESLTDGNNTLIPIGSPLEPGLTLSIVPVEEERPDGTAYFVQDAQGNLQGIRFGPESETYPLDDIHFGMAMETDFLLENPDILHDKIPRFTNMGFESYTYTLDTETGEIDYLHAIFTNKVQNTFVPVAREVQHLEAQPTDNPVEILAKHFGVEATGLDIDEPSDGLIPVLMDIAHEVGIGR